MKIDLTTKAAQLWPGSPTYQAKWIKSIMTLRQGRGWVLDGASVNWRFVGA